MLTSPQEATVQVLALTLSLSNITKIKSLLVGGGNRFNRCRSAWYRNFPKGSS